MRAKLILGAVVALLCGVLFSSYERGPVAHSGNWLLPTLFPEKLGTESAERLGAMFIKVPRGKFPKTKFGNWRAIFLEHARSLGNGLIGLSKGTIARRAIPEIYRSNRSSN